MRAERLVVIWGHAGYTNRYPHPQCSAELLLVSPQAGQVLTESSSVEGTVSAKRGAAASSGGMLVIRIQTTANRKLVSITTALTAAGFFTHTSSSKQSGKKMRAIISKSGRKLRPG